MIKRWFVLWVEFFIFVFIFSFAAFLYLEPFLKDEFEEIVSQKFGLKAEVGYFYFSPTGTIEGRDLHMSGDSGKLGPVELVVKNFKLEPKEFIYAILFREKGKLDWKKFPAIVKLNDFNLKVRDVQIDTPEAEIDFEDNKMKLILMKPQAVGKGQSVKARMMRLEVLLELDPAAHVLDHLVDYTVEEMQIQGGVELRFDAFRLQKGVGEWLYNGGVEWMGQAYALDGRIRQLGGGLWQAMGRQAVPLIKREFTYQAQGPLSLRGPWAFSLTDLEQNKLDLDLTISELGECIMTWNLDLNKLVIEGLQGAAISGDIQGGASFTPREKSGKIRVKAENLNGSPYKVSGGRVMLDASFDDSMVRIASLTAGEQERWSGNINGEFLWRELSPKKFQILVSRFPLDQYTASVGGKINIEATYEEPILNFKMTSPGLSPDLDPLDILENFRVTLKANHERVEFYQRFSQSGHVNEILTEVMVPRIIEHPMAMKEGRLLRFISKSELFDLSLVQEVPVRVSLEGLEIPQYHIDDKNLRLRNLKGSAYIPFLRAPRLDIRGEGYLDMDYFPTLAGSPLKGRLNIRNAVWNQGWSIGNIYADFEGGRLQLAPEAILPVLLVEHCKGRLKDKVIFMDDISGHTDAGGKFKVSGNYYLWDRQLDLDVVARDLDYDSKTYHMKYDLDRFSVKGEVRDLSIQGEMGISRFNYTEPFAIAGQVDGLRRRPRISSPEVLNFKHRLDLSIKSKNNLVLKNNVGDLNFVIPSLRIKGPLDNPGWFGDIMSTTSPGNRLIVPIQPLEVIMKASEVRVHFDGEDEWDPRYTIDASTVVDGVQINFNFSGRLEDFINGDFNLTSVPSYPRESILKMLVDGRRPQQRELYDQVSQNRDDNSIDGISIIDRKFTPGPLKETTYRARVTSGSDPFEFSVNYDLARFIQAEVAQRSENNTFVGLRFSKQADNLRTLIRIDRGEKAEAVKRAKVIWDIQGLPDGSLSKASRSLRQKLANIEPVLSEGDHAEARKLLEKAISQHLAEQGYMNASFSVQEMSDGNMSLQRRNGQRSQTRKKITIRILVHAGDRYRLKGVNLQNWPAGVPMIEDEWLVLTGKRQPGYNPAHLEQFNKKLMSRLAEHGYPAAKVATVEAVRVKEHDLEALQGDLSAVVDNTVDHDRSGKNAFSKPIILEMRLDVGELHHVQQIYIKGLSGISANEAMDIMGYAPRKAYCELDFDNYRTRLLQWYEKHGYFDTKVNYRVLMSRRFPMTSLHFTVEEGYRWKIRNIFFEGLGKFNDKDLWKVITTKPGAQARSHDIRQSVTNLYHLNVFSRVDTVIQDVPGDAGQKDLTFKVEVSPLIGFSTRIGYESSQGIQGSFRVRLQNFAGLGRSLSLENDFSSKETIRKAVYSDALILHNNMTAQAALGEKVESISVNEIINRQRLVEAGVVKNIQDLQHQSLFLAFQQDRNKSGHFPSLRLRFNGDYRMARMAESPQPGFGLSSRNSLVSYLEDTYSSYFGDYRFSYGFKTGAGLFTPWVRYGHTIKNSDFDIPLADRLFLGGTNSLRGFKEDAISGENGNGGESLAACGLQYFYPLSSWVDGTVFLDSGRVYENEWGGRLIHFHTSGGFGSVLRTPVGPIQIYVAKPTSGDPPRFGVHLGTIF